MKTALVMASTFPRWKDDTTPSFVFELSSRLAKKGTKIIVLAPHAYSSKKEEKMGDVYVHRFQYCIPAKLQKLAYGAGIIPNAKSSFTAKLNIPFFLLSEYLAARKLISRYNPDIIHAHWLIPQGIIAAMLKKETAKLIVTVHGSDLFPLKNALFSKMQKFVLRNCNICTVSSEATKNELLKRFPEFKDKVIVLSMGIDTNLFAHTNSKSGFSKYKNKKIMLFVGRLNEQKGIQYLIRAMPIIRKNIKNALLLVIGEGGYKSDMQKLAASLDISDSVEFLGAIPHKELSNYYNLADAFVLPSVTSKIGTEGLGLVLLEAMSCGTPVVGTETGGIRYIIKNNENGLLARERDEHDLADKIIRAVSDLKLRQKLSKNGTRFAKENYSWDIIVKKFDALYKS